MTNEEARQWFLKVYSEIKGQGYSDENEEAYELAIKALEKVSNLEKICEELADMPCITPEEMQKCKDIVKKYTPKQEPCDDAISRQAVLDGIEELKQSPWFNDDTHEAKIIRKEAVETVEDLCVKQLPSVRPQEQAGHWKRISMDRYTTHAQYWYECDKCGEHNLGNTNFCPNCGARMESEKV